MQDPLLHIQSHLQFYGTAGLRIEALEEEQKEEDDSTISEATDSEEDDEAFVVSDGEAADQPDFEVNNPFNAFTRLFGQPTR